MFASVGVAASYWQRSWECFINNNNMKSATNKPESKEGLHTQGEDLELVCKEYNGIYTIRKTCFNLNGLDVAEMTTNQPLEKQKELGDLIVKAVNERKALLDSHKELLDALNVFMEFDREPKYHGAMPIFLRTFRDKANTAINNAKNI